ncbi:MAG TPA: PucR family transcriptional regulator [Conexibacter sp.]|nr:PucR family transcriptional regulator [Conexibacter sp.]
MLSLRDVLELPALRLGLPELVCGVERVDRPVRWAHVMDIANVDGLLKGQELILSTGAAIGDDPQTQRAFVRQLVDEDASGLAIELGSTYRTRLPEPMTAQARKDDFPLIAFRRRVRFIDITEAVHSAVVEEQIVRLRRAEQVQGEFLDLLLQGGSVRDLLEELARMVGNPVVFENAARQLVAYATHQAREDVALAAWESYASLDDEAHVPGALEADVTSLGRIVGRLVVLEVDAPLDAYVQLVLDRAAVSVSLEMRRHNHEEHLHAQTRGLLLADLAHGRLHAEDVARRAATQGFPRHPGNMLPLVASWRSGRWQSLGSTMERAWVALGPALKQVVAADSRAVLMGPSGTELLMVLDLDARVPETADLDRIAESLGGALARRGLSSDDVVLAIGPVQRRWEQIGSALLATTNAAGVARALPPRSWHDARRHEVTDFLFAIRGSPELQHFIDRQLGPLLDDERRRNRGLLLTLETYLAKGGRKTDAARALNLERQSLYSRLQRIEELLGVRLDDEDVALSLHLACRARRMLGELGTDAVT